jgi:hypothetical protein
MFLVFKNGNPPQIPLPSTMTPEAITSALAAAQALFLPIDGQPSDNNLIRLSDAILPILLKATYDRINGVHNLWGLVASTDCYLHHYGTPFVCPATHLACYYPAITAEASPVDRVCAKTAWATLLQDYKAYKAAERGIKVFIKAVVNDTWICNLCNPKTFYSNVTALEIFNHLCKHSGGLHALDMILLTIQMSKYYDGTPDIPEYIFLLKDAQRKAARARLPVTDQTLTILASTALLAADTFPRTTELWEELDPANRTWAAWKTAYLAAHKKRANHLRATGEADYLGRANSAHSTTLNPSLLDSIDNALNNLASATSNKKAILEQLIASNSSLATSNSNLPNQVKTLRDQLAAKSRSSICRVAGSNDPNKRRGPDLDGYCWSHDYRIGHGHTSHTCFTPRKVTSPPPRATTSWLAPLPTRTGRPTGAPEAPGRTYKQKLSLLRPLNF